jgi:hypothetical protein
MKLKINDWDLMFFEYKYTYRGILCGAPSIEGNERFIKREIDSLCKSKECKISDINLVKEYFGYFGGTNEYDKCEHALKSVCIKFCLTNYEIEKACIVIAFADESESPEDAINRIMSSYKIQTFDWSW